MKAYAERFYKSKAWIDTRAAYLITQQHICERCGMPATMVHHKTYITAKNINDIEITLCFDNLEALCNDCHNKEHHKNKTESRYKYDCEGNIIISPHNF